MNHAQELQLLRLRLGRCNNFDGNRIGAISRITKGFGIRSYTVGLSFNRSSSYAICGSARLVLTPRTC